MRQDEAGSRFHRHGTIWPSSLPRFDYLSGNVAGGARIGSPTSGAGSGWQYSAGGHRRRPERGTHRARQRLAAQPRQRISRGGRHRRRRSLQFSDNRTGRYTATASAPGMAEATQSGLELHVGGSMQLQFRLRPAGHAENIKVIAPPTILDPDSGEVSQVIDE